MGSKVSVIIPIYNVEEYLPRCLDSVTNQTYKNLEIICVNDCSPDNSAKILEDYSKKDNRIKIINREKNGGLSAARNTGMEYATGEYIYFIDSDDWIDSKYIKKMVNIATQYKTNIVVNTNVMLDYEDKPSEELFFGNIAVDKHKVTCIKSDTAINNIMWSAWSHLYKRDFIIKNNLIYPEGYIYEDMYFTPVAYSYLEYIYAFHGPIYHYCIRENSICKLQKDEYKKKMNLLSIFEMVFKTLKENKYIDTHSIILYPKDFLISDYKNVDQNIFLELRKYFEKIESYVMRDTHLYDTIELQFFKDILTDIEKAKNTNYTQRILISKLRQNVTRRISSCQKSL